MIFVFVHLIQGEITLWCVPEIFIFSSEFRYGYWNDEDDDNKAKETENSTYEYSDG